MAIFLHEINGNAVKGSGVFVDHEKIDVAIISTFKLLQIRSVRGWLYFCIQTFADKKFKKVATIRYYEWQVKLVSNSNKIK